MVATDDGKDDQSLSLEVLIRQPPRQLTHVPGQLPRLPLATLQHQSPEQLDQDLTAQPSGSTGQAQRGPDIFDLPRKQLLSPQLGTQQQQRGLPLAARLGEGRLCHLQPASRLTGNPGGLCRQLRHCDAIGTGEPGGRRNPVP